MKNADIKKRPMLDTTLASLEAEQTEYRELDGNGLYFRVKPDGKWSSVGIDGYSQINRELARKKSIGIDHRYW